MNAARYLVRCLPRESLLRLLRRPHSRFSPAATPRSEETDDVDAVSDRYALDLAALLNTCRRDELEILARRLGVPAAPTTSAAQLRATLWRWGAEREAGGADWIGTPVQPAPVLLGGRLIHLAPPRGLWPAALDLPRPLPAAVEPAPPVEEPESVDELLAAADRAVGVRLGPRAGDKGAWGSRAAALLGVVERGDDEPDWRGDVEIKTVPVSRDRGGLWRVVEDPAICMVGRGSPLAKLQRVLWLVRAAAAGADAGGPDATILSWYFLEWDRDLARLVGRYLHQRPKGPAGTRQRGWYLHKAFFADAGLLATLNGP